MTATVLGRLPQKRPHRGFAESSCPVKVNKFAGVQVEQRPHKHVGHLIGLDYQSGSGRVSAGQPDLQPVPGFLDEQCVSFLGSQHPQEISSNGQNITVIAETVERSLLEHHIITVITLASTLKSFTGRYLPAGPCAPSPPRPQLDRGLVAGHINQPQSVEVRFPDDPQPRSVAGFFLGYKLHRKTGKRTPG